MSFPPQDRPLFAYYGDDFTGSTDVMEVLTFAGLPTALFTEPPEPEALQRFPGLCAVGVAGMSRARSPEWMDTHLPPVFRRLDALGPVFLHYKICSTFDSSPHLGNIGRAAEIAMRETGHHWASMIVAAPHLRRFQVFGNLFAVVDGAGYRLDRHPTMSRHPVTPMDESDLRLHLARQTDLTIGLADFIALETESGGAIDTARAGGARIVLLDAMSDETMVRAGAALWSRRGDRSLSISSSGLQYALIAHWRRIGLLPALPPAIPLANHVSPLLVISGSCSPATARQIAWARAEGWHCERVEAAALITGGAEAVAQSAAHALSEGRDTVLYSAEGPEDPAIADFEIRHGHGAQTALGEALADLARRLMTTTDLQRLLICGGDTSGLVMAALETEALTALAPVDPGSPICRLHSKNPLFDGRTVALKGGQVGLDDYFGAVRDGGRAVGKTALETIGGHG